MTKLLRTVSEISLGRKANWTLKVLELYFPMTKSEGC